MSLTWNVRDRQVVLDRPVVIGILNVIPDRFSDGGMHDRLDQAVRYAADLVEQGADIVDVGGESTRPQNAQAVSEAEELERVIPVVTRIVEQLPAVIVSVDT